MLNIDGVKKCAELFLSKHPELDILILESGIVTSRNGYWRNRLCGECGYCNKHTHSQWRSVHLCDVETTHQACPDFIPREVTDE